MAVTSAHRGEAFQACEFLMDYLKTQAPFWKKETDAGRCALGRRPAGRRCGPGALGPADGQRRGERRGALGEPGRLAVAGGAALGALCAGLPGCG